MLWEQEDLTEEQAASCERLFNKYFDNLRDNKFSSPAERLSLARKMFDGWLMKARLKSSRSILEADARMLKSPLFFHGLLSPAVAAILIICTEIAEALNELEIEQHTNKGSLDSPNTGG